MIEIELKAHVDDRDALIERLKKNARFAGSVIRDDCYWGRKDGEHKKIRIRRETGVPSDPRDTRPQILLTYKRKEIKTDELGFSSEVNDEKECVISNPAPLEAFLKDNGFEILLKKHKEVMAWTLPITTVPGASNATFELCQVPPLGDFLEIEILAADESSKTTEAAQKELKNLLNLAGIPSEKIEERYYSELLDSAKTGL